jgi:hypothetical protein
VALNWGTGSSRLKALVNAFACLQLGRLVFPPARLSPQYDDIYQWENRASSDSKTIHDMLRWADPSILLKVYAHSRMGKGGRLAHSSPVFPFAQQTYLVLFATDRSHVSSD